jgi:hypothetical protein
MATVMSGGDDWIGFPAITSAQCQRHVRCLARQLIFIVFNSRESEGASNE